MRLKTFNALSERDAVTLLQDCCFCDAWAEAVAAGRPFPSIDALLAQADAELAVLADRDVQLALYGHPRIGERDRDFGSPAWSKREQAGVATADPDLRAAFAQANGDYQVRFGHAFLVHVDGRSAEELLAVLHERMKNDLATEARVLRAEMARLNDLRLRGLFA